MDVYRQRLDWWVVLGLIGALAFCLFFWATVAWGISALVGTVA